MIIASCGHQVTAETQRFVSAAYVDRLGNKCVSYKTVCDRCEDDYKDCLFESEQERDAWLSGAIEKAVW